MLRSHVALAAALFCFACSLPACKRDHATADVNPKKTGAPASSGDGFVSVSPKPSDGALVDLLRAESAKAKQRGLKPFAELRASWCGPCLALEKSMTDPRMKDAFAGVYWIHLDADEWSKSLKGAGLDPSAIPVFFELGDDGKPTGRKIDGGAWDDNIPENMAPPLKKFFKG